MGHPQQPRQDLLGGGGEQTCLEEAPLGEEQAGEGSGRRAHSCRAWGGVTSAPSPPRVPGTLLSCCAANLPPNLHLILSFHPVQPQTTLDSEPSRAQAWVIRGSKSVGRDPVIWRAEYAEPGRSDTGVGPAVPGPGQSIPATRAGAGLGDEEGWALGGGPHPTDLCPRSYVGVGGRHRLSPVCPHVSRNMSVSVWPQREGRH